MHREIDVVLLAQRLVPGRSRLFRPSQGARRDALDRLNGDASLGADGCQFSKSEE